MGGSPVETSRWPPPLAEVWKCYLEADHSYVKVHRLIDVIEVFVKFLTVVTVQEALTQEGVREKVQAALAGRLNTPSLGTWGDFLFRAMRELSSLKVNRLPEIVAFYTSARTDKPKTQIFGLQTVYRTSRVASALEALVKFRNTYAHGATFSDETRKEHVRGIGPLVESLLGKASFLASIRLGASEENPPRCRVLLPSGDALSLWPLMLFDREERSYYFFNDRKQRRSIGFLDYVRATFREESSPEVLAEFERLFADPETTRLADERATIKRWMGWSGR
jgi:hypothetical protein